MERDPLLENRWREKAAHEHGQEIGERGIDLYYSFLERAQKNPQFKLLADGLEKAVGDYAEAVLRFSSARVAGGTDTIQRADQHRHIMHEALIGAVNSVSRWYGKQKIDNSWRYDIIGRDREDVGTWALSVARHVLGKNVEE